MAKQVPTFTDPSNTSGVSSLVLRNNFNTLGDYVNDHDAQHWPIKLSAPFLSDLVFATSTGGSLTTGQAHLFRVVYGTPNGQTKRSSEQSVTLSGGTNSVLITFPAAASGFTPTAYVYKVLAAGVSGDPAYQCSSSHMTLVSGTGASIASNGAITLSTTGTTVIKVTSQPPNTQVAAPSTNSSGSIDPLQMTVAPIPFTATIQAATPATGQTTVTKTYTLAGGSVVETGIYEDITGRLLTSGGHTLKMGGITVARYSYTYDSTTGHCTSRSQVEAN